MNLIEILKISINSILANRVRAILTMLGIVIGISAVIALMSLGQGAQSSILEEVQGLGSNTLTVIPVSNFGGFPGGRNSLDSLVNNKFDYGVVKILQNKVTFKEILNISPEVRKTFEVNYRSKTEAFTIQGVEQSHFDIRGTKISKGRLITDKDNLKLAKVAVIGPTVEKKLFGESDSLGKDIKINGSKYQIIGVTEEKSNDFDETVFLPFNTETSFLIGSKNLNQIIIKVRDEKEVEQVKGKIDKELRKYFHLQDSDEATFSTFSSQDILSLTSTITGVFTALLSSIAGISLLVGGIGIMNIMLVSVTERTKEIGLRKAVGAKQKAILLQFLMEAIVLTLLGGVIGITLGLILGFILGKAANIPVVLSPSAIILATSVSAFIGIVFGFYPAYRAARLNPIDALRYE